MRVSFLAVLLLAATGCSSNPPGGTPDLSVTGDGGICIPGLKSIALTPADSTVQLDGKTAAPITFTATGTFEDGHAAPLTSSSLGWSVTRADDTPPGTITNGVLTPSAGSGGTVTVKAADGCGVSGSTTVQFQLQVQVGTPSDATAWSGTPVTTTPPTIVYPSDQTRFPRNIYRTLFQWRTAGYTQFRLLFEGPGGQVTVYTDGKHALCANKTPAAGCWEADEAAWGFIAGSNAGSTVTVTLDALDASKVIHRATPITLGFSKRDVKGAIFYWSTTSAGVRRANVAAAAPEDYITGRPGTVYQNPSNTVQCVACHVVSRDGKYMVAPVQSSALSQSLWVMEVTAQPPPNPLVTSIPNTGGHGFATISPDDEHVVAAFGGKMWRVDRATGAYGEQLPLPAGISAATHPDWSPDGSQVVYATGKGDAPSGASLAVTAWLSPGWGTAKTIIPADGLSNLFPQFSPDGKWIAYSRGKGGHGDLTAQLFVAPASGTNPIELVNANRVVSNKVGDGQNENNQPTWAPSGDFEWVAFNSVREYGVVLPKGTQQIWVAAVDKTKAQTGVDPSYPAFRLQFQGLNEDNHRAYWTLDIRDPPDGGTPPPPPPPDAGTCTQQPANHTCNPVTDCCPNGYLCDTADSGLTYTCLPVPG